MKILLSRIKELESDIDTYLDKISRSALSLKQAAGEYLDGQMDLFEERSRGIDKLEGQADEVRHNIKYKLYTNLLIPDARGDVLGLIENLDNIPDSCKNIMQHFLIEKPVIPESLHPDILRLADATVNAVEEVIKSTNCFFRELDLINDHLNKVHFWESEADKFEIRCKEQIFNGGIYTKLSEKLQMRDFITMIASLSDEAENVSERLSIYAIKRSI